MTMKQQYFYRQEGGWFRAKPRNFFSAWDEYAIEQNKGPMIGVCTTPETLRIRGNASIYEVRVSWEGRVHHRNIDFEHGARVDVEFGYLPPGLKRGNVIASLLPSSVE